MSNLNEDIIPLSEPYFLFRGDRGGLNASLGIREISQRITIISAGWDWRTAQMRFITAPTCPGADNEVTDDARETRISTS